MQLAAFNNNNFTLGHAAMLVNEGLPALLRRPRRAGATPCATMTVGILGMAFKAESDDPREPLLQAPQGPRVRGRRGALHRPVHRATRRLLPLDEVVERADLLIVGAPHEAYRALRARHQPVIDVWNLRGRGVRV